MSLEQKLKRLEKRLKICIDTYDIRMCTFCDKIDEECVLKCENCKESSCSIGSCPPVILCFKCESYICVKCKSLHKC